MSKPKNQDINVGQTRIDIQTLNKARDVIRAINNPVRKEIIRLLEKHKQLDVSGIQKEAKIKTQTETSQSLAILRNCNVIQSRTEGKYRFYSLNREAIENIATLVEYLSKHSK